MAYKSSSRGGAPIRLVALHSAEGARTASSLGAYFWRPEVEASSHIGIDAGHTLRYVPDDRAAWTLRSGNPISLNAEMCAFARWTRAQWLSTGTVDGCVSPRAIVRRAAAWARQSCLAHDIPMRRLTATEVAQGKAGIIDHYAWTIGMRDGTHSDVGKGFPWDVFFADLDAPSSPPQEDDMSLDDKLPPVKMADGKYYTFRVRDVLHGLAQQIPGNGSGANGLTPHPMGQYVSYILATKSIRSELSALTAAVSKLATDPGIDESTISAILHDAVRQNSPSVEEMRDILAPVVEDIARRVAGQDNEDIAEQIIREFHAELGKGLDATTEESPS